MIRKRAPGLEIVPLYKKFFRFLEVIKKRGKPWPAYWRFYYFPYRQFFDAYFSFFPLLDREALKERVEAIRPQHYYRLRMLLRQNAVEKILRAVHPRCLRLASPENLKQVKVYLIIGFFSPEAFLLSLKKEKVIVFGLERFRDLSSLDLLYAHEYAHWLLQEKKIVIPKGKRAIWYLVSEGLACWFSSQVLPERPLTEHLFLRRDRLNWCLENESLLKEIFRAHGHDLERIMNLEQQGDPSLGLPPRSLHFLAYQFIENQARQLSRSNFQELIRRPEKLLNLTLDA